MQYDFDTPIDRTHTWSIKHDFKKENGKADDILLWVLFAHKIPPPYCSVFDG